MGSASLLLFIIGVIIAICTQVKDNSDSKRHQQENPYKKNMTNDEFEAWLIKDSDIAQREGWKKLGL